MEYNEQEHLLGYVSQHCTSVMTTTELATLSHFRLRKKAQLYGGKIATILEQKSQVTAPNALALIELGEQAFSELLRDRIVREYPTLLNRCPNCAKVPRTPTAKQCPWCFHSWRHLEPYGG